jgi:hypothetical protein
MRRIQALGATSLYRILDVDGEIVAAEVVDVPGLRPGMVVRLTVDAVAAMDLVDTASASRPGPIADAA